MKYQCAICGKMHEDWPAIGFDSPYPYNSLSENEKQTIAELSDDFCIINYEDQVDRFIRAVLFQKVKGQCDPLHYGVWVSLSEKSFNDYKENFHNENYETTYFGYLYSQIPGYEDTLSIKANVILSKGGNRPEVIPHDDQMDNQFVKDYYKGISIKTAQKRIDSVLND